MAAIGLAIGLPAVIATGRLLEGFLFQMKPTDPLSLMLAVVTLLAALVFAGYGPARRASRVVLVSRSRRGAVSPLRKKRAARKIFSRGPRARVDGISARLR